MRVIAGTHRGIRLFSPRWSGLRPTSDRLRETLFDVLGNRVEGSRVLDGCAGTGAVGIEALSRGASYVLFIERDHRSVSLIRRNVRRCGFADRCTIRCARLPGALKGSSESPFDLAFLDPPYGAKDIGAILTATVRHLSPRGLLVFERQLGKSPLVDPGLKSVRVLRAGGSVLELYIPVAPNETAAQME